jgi:hypothetical protein
MKRLICWVRSFNVDSSVTLPFTYERGLRIYQWRQKYPLKSKMYKFIKKNYGDMSLSHDHVIVVSTDSKRSQPEVYQDCKNRIDRLLAISKIVNFHGGHIFCLLFYDGNDFQNSWRYDLVEGFDSVRLGAGGPLDLSDFHKTKKIIEKLGRLTFKEENRITNFYQYLLLGFKGEHKHRFIWLFIALESLFKLSTEKYEFSKTVCSRTALFLYPSSRKLARELSLELYAAYNIRATIVHGKIYNYLLSSHLDILEETVWSVGNKILMERVSTLKLFAGTDNLLEGYFKRNFSLYIDKGGEIVL